MIRSPDIFNILSQICDDDTDKRFAALQLKKFLVRNGVPPDEASETSIHELNHALATDKPGVFGAFTNNDGEVAGAFFRPTQALTPDEVF